MPSHRSGTESHRRSVSFDPRIPPTSQTPSIGVPQSRFSGGIEHGPAFSQPSKKSGARVIRTFEEIEKTVALEEWYEELECGICSHVLGAPQALVPCGHTFCGPCAWTWIKINHNNTCPHCRIPVNDTIPLVPNIMVDQIIDRKLQGLPDGSEKSSLTEERTIKSEDWKVLQATIVPPKPPPKRSGVFSGFIEAVAAENAPRRRASRSIPILGEPIVGNIHQPGIYAGMRLADAARLDLEADRRRAPRGPVGGANQPVNRAPPTPERLRALERFEESLETIRAANNYTAARAARQPLPIAGPPARHGNPPSIPAGSQRDAGHRFSAFAARQARGRESGSVEHPVLVVDSDSDSD